MIDRAAKRLVSQALLSLARDDDDRSILETFATHQTLLLDAAIAQGLGLTLAKKLAVTNTPLPAALREHREDSRFLRMAAFDTLPKIDSALTAAGIPWVTLKGPIVASSYPNPEERAYVDVDVLVRGRDLGSTIATLEALGLEDVNRNWGNYVTYGVAETPLWSPGLAIDLHWHVIALRRNRELYRFDTAAMIERRCRVSIGAVDLPALDPEDRLLHVCTHAGISGAGRLGWIRDVHALVNADPPRWDVLAERAKLAGVAGITGQVLDRAAQLLLTPVPSGVVRDLCPTAPLTARRALDRLNLGAPLPETLLHGLPVKVTQATARASVRKLWSIAKRRYRTASPTWNVGDPEGPLYWDAASGGPDARSQYLAMAAADSPT